MFNVWVMARHGRRSTVSQTRRANMHMRARDQVGSIRHLLCVGVLALGWIGTAQAQAHLDALIERECRPLGVLPAIARGIIAVESNANPLALGVQFQGGHRSYYPTRKAYALALLDLLLSHTDNVGIGLMQINWRAWGQRLGVQPGALLEPGLNVRTGCRILRDELLRLGVSRGIGAYHSPTPARRRWYRAKVVEAIERGRR